MWMLKDEIWCVCRSQPTSLLRRWSPARQMASIWSGRSCNGGTGAAERGSYQAFMSRDYFQSGRHWQPFLKNSPSFPILLHWSVGWCDRMVGELTVCIFMTLIHDVRRLNAILSPLFCVYLHIVSTFSLFSILFCTIFTSLCLDYTVCCMIEEPNTFIAQQRCSYYANDNKPFESWIFELSGFNQARRLSKLNYSHIFGGAEPFWDASLTFHKRLNPPQGTRPVGLHDIGKNWHCDMFFPCDIYCNMKKYRNWRKYLFFFVRKPSFLEL